MKLIDEWLLLAEQVLDELGQYSVSMTDYPVEREVIIHQITELKNILNETRENGFFSEKASNCYLLAVVTREELKIDDKIIEDVAYLFDISRRAIRLGPIKADKILQVRTANKTVQETGTVP